MSNIQLSFSLRVSGAKSVHLLGSWDNYVGQIPLAKDKTSSKSGAWKGTFRFQGNLEAGRRYWYYYIIDGYQVSHNPSEASTVEPTTGRELNILDIPMDVSRYSTGHRHQSSKHHSSSTSKSRSSSKRASLSLDIPKGRPLSYNQIKAPKPISPHAASHILDADLYDENAIEELTARFGRTAVDEYGYEYEYEAAPELITDFSAGSPVSSVGSDFSSPSSYRSSASSSVSGYSTPGSECSTCTCERYGITRRGDRVKIDCGGARCGYSDDDDCSSGNESKSQRRSRHAGLVA